MPRFVYLLGLGLALVALGIRPVPGAARMPFGSICIGSVSSKVALHLPVGQALPLQLPHLEHPIVRRRDQVTPIRREGHCLNLVIQ